MDVHVPIAITEGLRRQGIDVLTSQENGTREVIFAHQQGLSIGLCIEELGLIAKCCSAQEVADRVVYIPLR